jgi:hypothetical protein
VLHEGVIYRHIIVSASGMKGCKPLRRLPKRYEQSTGWAPLHCPHRHRAMEVWCIWHPTYGIIYDELEAMRRGKYAS